MVHHIARAASCIILSGVSIFAFAQASAQEPALVVIVDDEYPSISPGGDKVAFESTRSGGADQIYVANMDGSNVTALTNSPEENETPIWSPDGERILFARRLGEGRAAQLDIFVMDADGGNVRNLSNFPDAQDDHHRYSADGTQIVFNSSRRTPISTLTDEQFENYGWEYDIYVMNADGSDQRPLVTLPGWDTYPSFSPDGEKLLWRRVLPTGGASSSGRNSEIFVAGTDGSEPVNISNHAAFDGYPVWSPDGEWIAFASSRVGEGADPNNVFRLFIMRPDGSDVRQVTHPPVGLEDARPAWTPDSQSIVFNRDAGRDSRIVKIDLTGELQ